MQTGRRKVRKRVPGRGTSQCKGPEAETCLVCLGNTEDLSSEEGGSHRGF